MSTDAYGVEGYATRTPEYDGPYLDGSSLDPNVKYAFAGDPEKQAQLQEIIDETDGAPVLANGVVTIVTADGEPNVVVLTKSVDEVKTIVLDETDVDRMNQENEERQLEGNVDRDEETGEPVNSEDVADLSGPSGKDEVRDGADYNPTVTSSPRAPDGTEKENTDTHENKSENSSGMTLS